MDWSSKAVSDYRKSKKSRFQNSTFYFKDGIGIPMIRSSNLTGSLINGRLFDQSIVGVFPKDDAWIYYLLGFINSSICSELINAINPSTNNSANYIKKIPFIQPDIITHEKVDLLVKCIISSIEDGDVFNHYKDELDNIFFNLYYKQIGMEVGRKKTFNVKQLNLFDTL